MGPKPVGPDRITDLRSKAAALFRLGCDAADPAQALLRALADHPLPRPAAAGAMLVVAIGKAAVPMTQALLHHLQGQPCTALVVTNPENACPIAGATVIAAGHPVPDENSAQAARAVEQMLAHAGAQDRVIALISGGGSALLAAPLPGVSLAEKAAVNQLLLAGGFEITQINLIRQSLSRLKGGGLVRAASPAPVTAYILSDVIGDDLRVIASGLTASPIGTRTQAADLLHSAGLWPNLPASVQTALTSPAPAPPHQLPPIKATNILIGSNRKSVDAVLAAAGKQAKLGNDQLTGDVAAAALQIIAQAQQAGSADCLVWGGETTVMLRGTGLGGRNQELALRIALQMPDLGRDWAFLSGGTDGRDGPTDAAGGLVDRHSATRMRQNGGDPAALLANNDSNPALDLSGDLLVTGATGTNVADLQILTLGPKPDP